ncbi:putative TraG conjugal transfer transmembrane protein (plasmid) [Methylorubrum populi]|uniref:Putative TraG conjugal transfer transmembrane protein n=1 Tax=Methylorubrum populi TaxID=223967 RepID=A0A169RJR3_9HYPH|nr:putative TraG conjugal transfer transmembrane protein [Methylorubrum populi]
MQASPAAGGLVARAANRHLSKSDREASGVLSAAQRHTHFLDSPRMGAVMARSDFGFADLKQGTCTVFLVLPPDRLDAYGRWLRLMVAQAITALARSPHKPPSPVLFLLDEFAALGRLEPVERAMGLMAGYGLQLWPILQDLHQLRSTYGQRAGTFLANAGVTQVFNVNDVDTAAWVSRALGDTTLLYETSSMGSSSKSGDWSGEGTTTSEGVSTHLGRRALLTPDEVRRLRPEASLLFLSGEAPILARKVVYHADPEFRGLFDPPNASAPPPGQPAPTAPIRAAAE